MYMGQCKTLKMVFYLSRCSARVGDVAMAGEMEEIGRQWTNL